MQSETRLNDSWNFWYAPRGRKVGSGEDYLEKLKLIGEVNTLEEFFSYYCYFKRPTHVPVDNKILLFRKSCKPLWEDWKEGGCWLLQFKKRESEQLLNVLWEKLLFGLIAEDFEDDPNNVNVIGVVVSVRQKVNVIEIWLRDGFNEKNRVDIGEKLRNILELDPSKNLTFFYKDFSKTLQDNSLFRNSEKYTFILTPLETPMTTPNQKTKDGQPVMEDLSI